ncbi:hypothetical protein B0T10DRAFT_533335 [Thelonectria olida]|uniref:Uncharacterized protein n=1 Tax=Thelonectria olida TaxID=1576542 RepID=A0A9P9AKT1_9HYPO|nr:hypothetical protein B0T10DRAFT_533335 [Thelonectria olida]
MASQTLNIDRYVVIHVATTCDEHGVYVAKDSAEVIELSWILLDANSLEEITHDSVLVKPVSTPSLSCHVRNAGTFRDAIARFDRFATEYLTSKNLDFVFVTLDAWDLRVQLPREARDKAVVLSSYLQHSRTFDLRTEYQRWQQHHPQSLPFGPSMLSNICAALEVEPIQSTAPIKHNLAFHLQALAPALPCRAMEVAITLVRVLRGLISKSQPPQEHPDRSKVLHMSGLPHGTTQSELESWFTQFGGRPIAFWTLRTLEQHKPTGTGFAVFSSHEEAAECLCMNGRTLNEKAIEISPSTSCVLDRTQGILIPFPPSKNRPRPSDWTCPSCGFSNFQRRTAYFRCSFPAVGAGPVNEIGDSTYGYGGYGPPAMMSPPPHGGYHGPLGHGGRMVGSGVMHFRAGDWKCGNEVCGFHNFAKNVCCLRCCASRAGAAVVADSGYPSSMDNSVQYSMSRGSMAGTPGSGDYNQHLVAPPSHYLPSGLGGGSRAAEAAFQSTSNGPASGGPSNF